MTLPRHASRGTRFAADCLLVAFVALVLLLVALYYPKAPERPRWPPDSQREPLLKSHR
jgi:hypothetical protein